MIAIEGLRKSYGLRPALRGISLQVKAGEHVGLVGPNGSGKTTLLRCLLGLVHFEGRVAVNGCDPLHDHVQAQRHVAYVPQRAPALPVPVGELVQFWVQLRGRPRAALLDAAERLGLDLSTVWTQRFPALSGGQQQKLLAAMALASACEVLLLDEPTANLDPAARAVFFEALAARNPAPTLLLSSHRIEELERLVQRVVVLTEGQVAFDEPIGQFLSDPRLAAAAGVEAEDRRVIALRRST